MTSNGRFPYAGAVDADGHILEPPDLWETYIDPPYRDRALRVVLDDDGLEELSSSGGARGAVDRRPALAAQPAGLPVDAGGHGRARHAGPAAVPRADLRRRGAVR